MVVTFLTKEITLAVSLRRGTCIATDQYQSVTEKSGTHWYVARCLPNYSRDSALSYIKKSSSKSVNSTAAITFAASLFFTNTIVAAPIKIAFIGDQGVRGDAQAVLSLVASEGTNLLLIQGDLGYDDNTASTWDANLNNILGADFPVLTVVGNHENFEWPIYQRLIQQRIDRVAGLSCSGTTGVKAKCSYGTIDIVHVSPGINEVAGVSPDDGYADFIDSSFADSDNRWRICSWHKPHQMMQTGSKTGPKDWSVYDACLDAGAMVALAHEHAYSRTHLLSDFSSQTIIHKSDEMSLEPGQSFAFVSGLGGREARGQARGGDYFASIYTADQGAAAGALFCIFEDDTADCYFKAINGAVPDQFSLTRRGSSAQPLSPAPPASASDVSSGGGTGYVFSRSDKTEYRWIDQNSNGQLGSIWIDAACAAKFGGTVASGNWGELMRRAPGFDTIANPCTNDNVQLQVGQNQVVQTHSPVASVDAASGNGFAFSRSDKNEYRWIDKNTSGDLGSVWIDKACADRVGGVKQSGDWKALMTLAPGFDTIASPCY